MGERLRERLSAAVRAFWETRLSQAEQQELRGTSDQGGRSAVTGGAHCDGLIDLVAQLFRENGIPETSIYTGRREDIPGFFRATKDWDLIVVLEGELVAAVEVKSQVGSFGNNFNNRTEEAIGNAMDLLTAYREGAFGEAPKPWLGYLMLLEDSGGSTSPVRVREPHFSVFPEFNDASYAKRYGLLCRRLVRERLYDAACVILSPKREGLDGAYRELADDVGFTNFAGSLIGKAVAASRIREET